MDLKTKEFLQNIVDIEQIERMLKFTDRVSKLDKSKEIREGEQIVESDSHDCIMKAIRGSDG